MRNFTSILTLMLFSLGVFAQGNQVHMNRPANAPVKKVITNRPTVPTHNSHTRATQPFSIAVNFGHTDSMYYAGTLGGAYYDNYAFRIGKNIPLDSLHDGDLRWGATDFDTLIDYNTSAGYSTSNTPTTVDSIIVLYSYPRVTAVGTIDTLYVNIRSGTIVTNANGAITNTILHTDTVIMDTSMMTTATGITAFQVNPNYHFAAPTKFSIDFDFRGDTTNHFALIGGYGDLCNNACAADLSSCGKNCIVDIIASYLSPPELDNAGNSLIIFPSCNQPSGNYDSTKCNALYLQNWNMFYFFTVAPPLVANPTADKLVVCPGGTVNLAANVSGGNPPFTYSWTSNNSGGVQNPTDPNTSGIVITSNAVDSATYTFKVVDGNGDSVVKTVKVLVKGISVNAGNDTTIACGTTATLRATVTGSLTGLNTQWTGPVTGSGLVLPSATQGKYVVTVSTTNSGTTCTAKDSVVVSLPITQTVAFEIHSTYRQTAAPHAPYAVVNFSPCRFTTDTLVNKSSTQNGWTFSWTYDHGAGTSSLSDNVMTAFATPGTDTITLTADSGGCSLTYTKIISVLDTTNANCRNYVGINTIDFANLVSVYPNPTSGMFNINFKEVNSSNVSLSVLDMVGRTVYSSNNFTVSGNETKSIDLGKNANGIYFVRIQVDGEPYTVKLNLNK